MAHIIAGLGNPGAEYENTRHNTGRMFVTWFAATHDAEWKFDKKLNAHVAKTKIGTHQVVLVIPDTFMNNSGSAIKQLIDSAKKAEKLMVIYDDLDLPFGTSKISFNRSSGGHRGIESIIKSIKTEAFARMRVGISPTTPTGKLKKPKGEEAVQKHILGPFKPAEMLELKKLSKKINSAIETFVTQGLEKSMTEFN